jgi:hypothetical protein
MMTTVYPTASGGGNVTFTTTAPGYPSGTGIPVTAGANHSRLAKDALDALGLITILVAGLLLI